MSFVMNLCYRGHNGSALSFAKEMVESGTVSRILSLPGCERYEYWQSLQDPETVMLVNQWKDQKALDDYHDSPLMKTVMNLREKYSLSVSAQRFIADNGKISEKDRKYMNGQEENMKSKVYFTRTLTPEKIVEAYEKLGIALDGKVAVKIHSGEKGNQNYLTPEFRKPMVDHVNYRPPLKGDSLRLPSSADGLVRPPAFDSGRFLVGRAGGVASWDG